MRKRRYKDNDWIGFVVALLILSGIILNKRDATKLVIYFYTILFIVLGLMIGWLFLKKYLRNKKLKSLSEQINRAGLNEYIENFINNWGLEKGRHKNLWHYRSFVFDWDRLEDFRKYLKEKNIEVSLYNWKNTLLLLKDRIQTKEELITRGSINVVTQKFSNLSGSDFERLLYRLFEAMGYVVQLTGKVGDQGGDLILNKGPERILIQAKRYGDYSVGNKAVQEAVAAKDYYNCTRSMVVSTATFTPEAVSLAKATNVELISKHQLQEMLMKYLKESWS